MSLSAVAGGAICNARETVPSDDDIDSEVDSLDQARRAQIYFLLPLAPGHWFVRIAAVIVIHCKCLFNLSNAKKMSFCGSRGDRCDLLCTSLKAVDEFV